MKKVNYIPVLLVLTLVLLMDLYVFQGIKVLLLAGGISLGYPVWGLYWLVSVTIAATFTYNVIRALSTGNIPSYFNFAVNTFLTFFVTKLVFVLVLFAEDVFRMGYAIFNDGRWPERFHFISQMALMLSAFPFFSFLYGVTKGKYNYKIHRHKLHFEDLPPVFDGFKIIQISDIHAGSFDNPKAVKRGVKLINAENADLVVFTGDLVNNKSEEIIPWLSTFSEIRAKYGKLSVLGNHDYGDYVRWDSINEKIANLNSLKKYHAEIGFRLLLDESVSIRKGGEEIKILGVENWGLGFGERGDLKKSMRDLNPSDFKVLLSHDPTHWHTIVKNYPVKVHLTLSGHTHGMQFGIEALGLKWSPVKYRYPHWAGLAHENGRYLYINRGFGFLGFSGRVGIWPEITEITLHKSV
ncbi:metallophosphoesterase [Desertivirga xinjiangensis]|uniref:metallophosphoesterase n=1 Tax=Desertivirga xinjiangensis TaxID=539206 RepID=UPI00210A309E|nr:metallophosphoesterase [Pedobacter xinjiangensis]